MDQTIEKVSFCAPDRNHEHGFAYICRDGTTRRWMCHGFHAAKESVRNIKQKLNLNFQIRRFQIRRSFYDGFHAAKESVRKVKQNKILIFLFSNNNISNNDNN